MLEDKILKLVEQNALQTVCKRAFLPGISKVTTGGAVFGPEEPKALVEVALRMWLTAGPKAQEFEKNFSKYLGVKHTLLTNSGSSANLLAFSALTCENLGKRRIKQGDEVITIAAGFPTTVNPIIQYGAVPVFVDIELSTLNIDTKYLEMAYSGKTKAVMIAHTLGNPFNLQKVKDFCDEHNLWLIEDCCDALGAEYDGRKVGSFGDLATFSFFPAHQITMGEGGAVVTNNPKLKKNAESFRDWGKACWCPPGTDNCCGARHCMKLGELPFGYDHKYVFTNLGYNLKVTEMQAAIGVEQLKKVEQFRQIRVVNNYTLKSLLYSKPYIRLQEKLYSVTSSSPFGCAITVEEDVPFTRVEFVKFLEDNQIQTRMLFGGNLTKHPAYLQAKKDGREFRVVGDLKNTNYVMDNTFWIGVHQGITPEMNQYQVDKITEFLERYQ
jgi:CDP-6-deoxy-D-xylo-4-hexulose-3-dehydrase